MRHEAVPEFLTRARLLLQTIPYAMLMAVMMPREKWTDDRLDDLNKNVEDGFARLDKKVDDGFARLDKKMDDGFAWVDKDVRELRNDMNSRFNILASRFEALKRT